MRTATADCLKRKAYTAVLRHDGWSVGLATENEHGYEPLAGDPLFADEDAARSCASTLNERMGLTQRDAFFIVTSSMFPMPPAKHEERRREWSTS